MKFKLVLAAALAALSLFAPTANAADEVRPGPIGCGAAGATTPASYVGAWRVRQRDDGYDWVDIAPHIFGVDGTFSETTTSNGVALGHWCVQGDVLIWGFDGTNHTTYRATIGREPMSGFMSWDGGGTGEVEIRR